MSQGWQCPVCNAVMNPAMVVCVNCTGRTSVGGGGTTPILPIPVPPVGFDYGFGPHQRQAADVVRERQQERELKEYRDALANLGPEVMSAMRAKFEATSCHQTVTDKINVRGADGTVEQWTLK